MLVNKRKSHRFQRTLNEKNISCRRIMRESVESVSVEDVASVERQATCLLATG